MSDTFDIRDALRGTDGKVSLGAIIEAAFAVTSLCLIWHMEYVGKDPLPILQWTLGFFLGRRAVTGITDAVKDVKSPVIGRT